ncbi:FAD-binding domain-containing protein [Roseobacter sp. CCS2]|uniref:FAD-binding domain-containing protein n=1 Tax=Roseobacter sp. CCS2 TaxID=391593 RepID=UPI0000F3E3A7|nr:FAD-binding domain-containing protein [Roseobacter sp. CCS2]EBA12833.1 deoxyribodipyrimidine photo-lyase, putative [Roseobacter sp. CCS2]
MFEPTYTAGLERLAAFVPHAGRDYASKRNYDNLAHVSALSPYIRHRIITEEDVLKATLARHSPQTAEKFIQEVYWRTYWKGWLEMRPSVWAMYRSDLQAALNRVQTESGLRQEWEAACKGDTGIDCFDHWAKQLADTGYLHNHARMWFASIWIFTLRLPWTLGADFFMRHLLDGDAASNTLSWRWVGGLQTIGKTYLARPDNITKYTEGRFHPTGLATFAAPLDGAPHPARGPLPITDTIDPNLRTGLLITEDDLSPGWLLDQVKPSATAIVQTTPARSPLAVSDPVSGFVTSALSDCAARFEEQLGPMTECAPDALNTWMQSHDLEQVVTSYLPAGPTRDALQGAPLAQIIRPYDMSAWPHATHGFFRFKDKIPKLLGQVQNHAV